jgi:hypothetical protein
LLVRNEIASRPRLARAERGGARRAGGEEDALVAKLGAAHYAGYRIMPRSAGATLLLA